MIKTVEQERYGIVKMDVMHDTTLSMRAKALYGILSTFADQNRECFPKVLTLAKLLGVSRRTVERAINELKEKNYVRKRQKIFIVK